VTIVNPNKLSGRKRHTDVDYLDEVFGDVPKRQEPEPETAPAPKPVQAQDQAPAPTPVPPQVETPVKVPETQAPAQVPEQAETPAKVPGTPQAQAPAPVPDQAPQPEAPKPRKARPKAAARRTGGGGKARRQPSVTTFARVPNEIAAMVRSRVTKVLDEAMAQGYAPKTSKPLSNAAALTLYVLWTEAAANPDVDGAKLIRRVVDDPDLADALVKVRGSHDRLAVVSDRLLAMDKDVRAMRDANEVVSLIAAYTLADRLALRKGVLPASVAGLDFDEPVVKGIVNAAADQAVRDNERRRRDHNTQYQESLRRHYDDDGSDF
jgi:hypothetical protein